jgi:hypothetical protein
MKTFAQHDFLELARLAREKARAAMHHGSPVAAREWIEAAAIAEAAADGDWDAIAAVRQARETHTTRRQVR